MTQDPLEKRGQGKERRKGRRKGGDRQDLGMGGASWGKGSQQEWGGGKGKGVERITTDTFYL